MKRLVVKLAAQVATLAVGAVLLAGGAPVESISRPGSPVAPASPVDEAGNAVLPRVRTPYLSPVFQFSPEVPPRERSLVRQSVREANQFFVLPHARDRRNAVTVYVFSDREALVDFYATRLGIRLTDAERAWELITGLAQRGWITMDLSAFPTEDLVRVLVYHEWFHLTDYRLRGSWKDIPKWLAEGLAEWAASKAVARFGDETPFDQVKAEMRHRARRTSAPLRSMETSEGFVRADPQLDGSYATAFWAIEYLNPTVPKLLRFLVRLEQAKVAETWEDIFLQVFGMPVERFYKGFERFRARAF